MRDRFRTISWFVEFTSTLVLGVRACGISPRSLLSCPTTTMQHNRSSTSVAPISKLVLIYRESARCWLMFHYIKLQKAVEGNTHSPSMTRMISQLKSRSWSRASHCTIGTRRGQCLWPWWRVRSGDPSSASHSTHSFTSARCRDRSAGIRIHVAMVRERITRVHFHEHSTMAVELVN